MKKIISLILVSLLMFSAIFCVPVSAASKTDGTFYYELSIDKTYYILVDTISGIKGSVKIPKEFNGLPVKEIGSQAFWDCTKITSVTICSNIKEIGEKAFGKCSKLSKISLSKYVKHIHSTAFDNTAYYKDKANWVSDVFYVGSHFIKADTDISGNYRIKEGTKSIAEGAFQDCDSLKAVVLPSSITAIHDYTFSGCNKLKHIYIPEGVERIGIDAFSGCNLTNIHLPSTLKAIGECAIPKMTAIYVPANTYDFDLWAISDQIGMIYGEEGSPVQTFAENEGLPFTPISEHTHTIEPVEYSVASVKTCGITYDKCDGCGDIFNYKVTAQKKPAKVKLKSVENTEIGVYFTWKSVSGADAYRVYRKASDEDDWSIIGVTKNTAYYDANAKNNKTYRYTVRALNEAGLGATNKTNLKIKYVSPPKITGIVNTTDGVKITWKRVKYSDKYRIYRMSETEGEWKRIKTITDNKIVKYVDEDAKSGERYYYKVNAYNGSYVSNYDSSTSGIIVRLSTPKLSSVTSTKSGVKFSWKKVTGADSYIVYRKTGSGDWVELKTIEGGSKVSYTDKTAKKGKTYYYTVKASKYGYYQSACNKTGLKIKDKY